MLFTKNNKRSIVEVFPAAERCFCCRDFYLLPWDLGPRDKVLTWPENKFTLNTKFIDPC